VKADPQAQLRLLELQAIDTALTQLDYRRRNLPEAAELEKLAQELTALEDERIKAQVTVDDLDRDIARLERDIEQVRARKERNEARLADSSTPPRELEALQHELVSLNRRQNELEDAELELMEKRESAQATLAEVEKRLAAARERRAETEARRDRALEEIAREEQAKRAAREPLVAELPAELVTLYEKIREITGGGGAAPLIAGRCGGCRIELAGADRARIKAAAPDEVVRCEECRRILVRTAESGL